MSKRVLTGIKPTGTPHIGNLLGAIRPAIALANEGLEAMYFIADYHALTTLHPPEHQAKEMRQLTLEVAATWLACGLDPEKTVFYRQSDIPEIFELSWALQCFTSKGWMNKAHAYKAAVAAAGGTEEADSGMNMGVYGYPILMAADILAFDVDLVPVGKDQVQHIEIARDIAQRMNHAYGGEVLKLPAPKIDENTATVEGTDGGKMSKSKNNVIPIFGSPKQLKKVINQIKTDSDPPEVPRDPEAQGIFRIFRAIATKAETEEFAAEYRAGGMGGGKSKEKLQARIEQEVGGAAAKYAELMAKPAEIDRLLVAGAAKARVTARRTMDRVRKAIGIV